MSSLEKISGKILLIRGKKVMLDRDLAELYGVETKTLKKRCAEISNDFRLILCLNCQKTKQNT